MQTELSCGKDYQMAWMLIYNTDFLARRRAAMSSDVTGIQQQLQKPFQLDPA
jgi:hypothetical protein